MKRFTKKLSNDKVALGKIYEHYVDSFDVDIIYGYQSERAKECGNRFYYGELIEKLAEYENLGTVEDFKNLIKEAQIMLKNNEKHKQSIKEQAKQEVIDELLEWINKNKNDYMCRANTQHISGKSFSPYMAGASITVYTDGFVDELKQKLNEMKGGSDE